MTIPTHCLAKGVASIVPVRSRVGQVGNATVPTRLRRPPIRYQAAAEDLVNRITDTSVRASDMSVDANGSAPAILIVCATPVACSLPGCPESSRSNSRGYRPVPTTGRVVDGPQPRCHRVRRTHRSAQTLCLRNARPSTWNPHNSAVGIASEDSTPPKRIPQRLYRETL